MPPRPKAPELPSLAMTAPEGDAEAVYAVNEALLPQLLQWLESRAGGEARAHLLADRGLPMAFVRSEGIGFIPEGRYQLRDWAVKHGYPLEVMVAAGHCKRSESMAGRAFREAHQREPQSQAEFRAFFQEHCAERPEFYRDYHVLVPILDDGSGEALHGNWLALPVRVLDQSGRVRIGGFQLRSCYPSSVIGKGERYRNPVNTVALNWFETLIGYASELQAIERSNTAVVVEGQFDRYATSVGLAASDPNAPRPGVLALGGCATRGGASGDDPAAAGVLEVLRGRRVLLFTDSDEVGTLANLDLAPRLARIDCDVRIVRVEDGWDERLGKAPKDPGELLSRGGPDAVGQAVDRASARSFVEFLVESCRRQMAGRPHQGALWQRLRIADQMVTPIGRLPEPLASDAAARVGQVLALPPASLREESRRAVAGPTKARAGRR